MALASTVVTGCTTKKYYTGGADGGSTGAPSSVSDVQPAVAFAGRTLDVTLTGSNTNWDASTTVDFGSDITVNKLTLSSAAGIVANITVPDTATLGARDVTVKAGSDSEAYKMTFTVSAPLTVTVLGSQQQGSILLASIVNNDPINHPFDPTSPDGSTFTNLALNLPNGFASSFITNATTSEIDVQLQVDVMAATGSVDIDVFSGPDAQAGTTCAAPGCFEYIVPKVLTIAAQTSTTLTNNATSTLTAPFASKIYTYTPATAGNLIVLGTTDTGSASSLIVTDSTGSFANELGSGASVQILTTDTTPIYVLVIDGSGNGNVAATITVADTTLNIQAGGEGTDDNHQNDAIPGVALTAASPILVANASFAPDAGDDTTTSDVDTYKVVVTGAGHSIHATTLPGDAGNATFIQFLDSAGDPIADASGSTDPFQNAADYFSDDTTGTLAAGTYYVQVTFGGDPLFGPFYDSTAAKYDLVVTIN